MNTIQETCSVNLLIELSCRNPLKQESNLPILKLHRTRTLEINNTISYKIKEEK